WNYYDKFMLGMAFTNEMYNAYPFQYNFAPMYSFARKQLNGTGHISYRLIKKTPEKIRAWLKLRGGIFGVTTSSPYNRAYYVSPEIYFQQFRQKTNQPYEKKFLSIRYTHTGLENSVYKYTRVNDSTGRVYSLNENGSELMNYLT